MPTDVNAIYTTACKVYDANGALVAPITKTLTVIAPDQTVSTPAISTVADGDYYADVLLNQEGLWKFQWVTTGPNTAKTDYEPATTFLAIVGLGDMRAYLGNPVANEDTLRFFMGVATEMVERRVGTCVIRTFTDDHIPGNTKPAIRLPHGPLPDRTSVTSVTSEFDGGTTWTADDLLVYPDSGVIEPKSGGGFVYGPWKATYKGGRRIIPQRFVQAYMLIVADLWAPMRGLADDPIAPDVMQQAELEASIPPGYEMPYQAAQLLMRGSMPGFG